MMGRRMAGFMNPQLHFYVRHLLQGPRKFCQRDAGPDLPLNTTCGIFLGVFLSAFIFSLVHLGITLDNLFGVTFYTDFLFF